MTNVIVNAIDVLGQEIDEGVVRISAADAQYNGGSLMLPEYHEQELVAGSTTITGVTSGKVVVTLHWGINRTATFRVFVPDTTEITLAELALQKYDSDPAVVSKVADAALRAEGAADRADDIANDFGTLEGVEDLVQSASDSASSASGSASAAASSASAAATSESNAADSEASAGTSASSAASSASDAAGSASAAAGSADSAAGSESQAASSASAAASSATVAVASAIDAEDAADRAEAGAATVGDAQAILTARDQAVTAKDGAVTAQTAAEAAATDAASAAATEVDKLKAGAPAAFDTLLEIANELVENESERAALANSIAAKADKTYVDGELTKKANTGDIPTTDGGYGTHHVSDPAADYPKGVSYGLFNATDESWSAAIQADTGYAYSSTFVMVLTLRQSGYTMSTTQMVFSYNNLHNPVFMRKWHDGAWGPFRRLTDDGHQHKVVDFPMTERTNWINNSSHPDKFVYTRPDGYLHGSMPTSPAHVANKEYVDGKVAGHVLTNSQLPVTELIPGGANLNNYLTTGSYVQNVNANAESGSNYPPNGTRAGLLEVVVGSTFVYQRYTEYTKGRVFSRAKYSSTWSAWAELLDASEATSVLGSGAYGKIVRRETGSDTIRVGNPVQTYHAANKEYVDGRTPEIRVVSTIPASPTPGVVYMRFG